MRWRGKGQADDAPQINGDQTFLGMDMKSQDPASIKQGLYREGYNVRCENGGLATRLGSVAPGALNAVAYNRIYGTGLFSNPNGLEWLAVAVSNGVWFVRDGEYPRFIPLADRLTYPVEFSQAFDVFFLWRGPNVEPLLWHGDWSVYWESFPAPIAGSGRSTVPNAYYAETASNRMLVPYGKDRVAVSDIADYTSYDWTIDDFQINAGESDDLVRVFPWQQTTILCFKRHSIFRVTGFQGDLSQATLEKLPGTLGLVGRHALVQVSGDVYFMSQSGVFRVSQVMVDTPQPDDIPVSDSIKPIIDAINWNAANLIRCEYRRDRIYFAVPLKNALRNNAVVVYNIVTNLWESIDTWGDPDFRVDDFIKMDYNGERRIYAIDREQGKILLLEQGKTDLMGTSIESEYQIDMAVMTRGYQGAGPRSNFQRLYMDCATWNPSFTIKVYPDGANEKVLVTDRTRDRTEYSVFGKPNWDPTNSNDDHRTSRREDYAVGFDTSLNGFMLGDNGIQIERQQEETERFPVELKARYLQFKIENSQGYMGVRTVSVDAFEDQRPPRHHT
jgi:hypothetical protein